MTCGPDPNQLVSSVFVVRGGASGGSLYSPSLLWIYEESDVEGDREQREGQRGRGSKNGISPKPGTRRECGSWSPCASHTPLEKQHVPVERLLEWRAWSLGLRSTIPQCVEIGHTPVVMQEAHVHVLRTLVERPCAPSDVTGGGEDLHVGERERSNYGC